jgi:hypothetical protein
MSVSCVPILGTNGEHSKKLHLLILLLLSVIAMVATSDVQVLQSICVVAMLLQVMCKYCSQSVW